MVYSKCRTAVANGILPALVSCGKGGGVRENSDIVGRELKRPLDASPSVRGAPNGIVVY